MNKIVKIVAASVLALAAVCGLQTTARAQNSDAILDKIEAANKSVSTIRAHFDQTRFIPANGRTVDMAGEFYFSAPDRMYMDYDQPEGDVFLINGAALYMSRSGKTNLFDTGKNALMKSLSNTLCLCVTGQAAALAQANNADITAEQTDQGYKVTLKARSKSVRGYSEIDLLYDKTTCLLTKMVLVESSGVSNTYDMSAIQRNVLIDNTIYNVPR